MAPQAGECAALAFLKYLVGQNGRESVSRHKSTTKFVFVRPLVVMCYALPVVCLSVLGAWLAVFASGPLGARLAILLFSVFFLWVLALLVLRPLAFARPGLVHAGLGREWITVRSPGDITVEVGVGRWPQIWVFSSGKSHPVVTTPGPLWFGSQARFRRSLEAARDKLIRAAFPEVPAPGAFPHTTCAQ